MSFEYDGEPYASFKNNIEEFMSSGNCRSHSYYYDFFSKYMMKDYKTFISIRQKELNIKGFFAKFFNINCSFTEKQHYSNWKSTKKVLRQSKIFFTDEKYNPFKSFGEYSEVESFYLNKQDFNKLKNVWKPYIEYIHENKMKNNPEYAIQTKVGNF
jgi:hypothetical protein